MESTIPSSSLSSSQHPHASIATVEAKVNGRMPTSPCVPVPLRQASANLVCRTAMSASSAGLVSHTFPPHNDRGRTTFSSSNHVLPSSIHPRWPLSKSLPFGLRRVPPLHLHHRRIHAHSSLNPSDILDPVSTLATSSSSPLADPSTLLSSAASSLAHVDPSPLLSASPPPLPLDLLSSWSLGVGVGLPCTVMACGDMYHRSTLETDDSLKLTLGGILLVTIAASYLWATPGVAPGFWDMLILAPLERVFRPKLRKEDCVLGKKLGEGGFGSVYKGKLANSPETEIVVKRANEFGAVEIWMNERIRRACPDACADFISGFAERKSGSKDEEIWLVFKYEGDATLANVLASKDFPYNVEEAVMGGVSSLPKGPEREMRIIRRIFRRILKALEQLHAIGIVHRDMKPQNMIFNTATGDLKIIDLGAAADLRVGINFNPREFLLDPRYAAPEQYIMSTQTPKAPPPPVAAALSPVLWTMNRPDRFDMYSAGLIFLQMCFPSLRSDSAIIQFNRQLKRCNYDLLQWREIAEKRGTPDILRGFELLDLNGGLGWQLVQGLMRFKPSQRVGANVALLHPFFDPNAPTLLQRLRLALLRLVYRDNTEAFQQLLFFMAKSGTPAGGGFTEASLQKFRRDERKKLKKGTWDRKLKAVSLMAPRKVKTTFASTFAGGEEEDEKKNAWWNRWYVNRSVDNKA